MEPSSPDVFSEARLGPITLRNRVIKAATFESRTPDALVTDDLIEFHRAMSAGGVGMSTVAYCAVSPGGRTNRHQIWMRPEAVPGLSKLVEAIHAEGAAASAQIGHAGPVANSASNRAPALSPHRFPNPLSNQLTVRPDAPQLRELVKGHAEAARLARDAGFDCVELHFGHHYLVSSFLSPLLNRRRDQFGGSLQNRARLAREIARAVRAEVGDSMAVIAKLNMEDGVRWGLQVEESVQIGRWLEADGALDALELTAGSSLLNPMYYFRGEAPRTDFANVFKGPMKWGMQAGGRVFLKEYPFRPLFLLDQALQFRRELSMPLILLGGVVDRASMDTAMSHGFEFVAMGRALVREPDLPRRLQADRSVKATCIHCNRCMPSTFSRTRCVIDEPLPTTR